jgi:hypothetical protein
MKFGLLIYLLVVIVACNSKVKSPAKTKTLERPTFDCLLATDSLPKKGYLILMGVPFSLTNTSADTLYFVSTMCNGAGYFLESDTTKVRLFQAATCFSDGPIVEKILPKDTLYFSAGLHNINASNEIKIGFRFISVDKETFKQTSFEEMKNKGEMLWITRKL